MSALNDRHALIRSFTAVVLPLSFATACSTGPTDTAQPAETPTTVSPSPGDSRLFVVAGNDGSTETMDVATDGTVTVLTSAPGSVSPGIVRLADGAVAVADSSGATVFAADLKQIAHAEGDSTGFVTHAVGSADGDTAAFAYAVGDGQHPDRHLIVTVSTDGTTFSTISNSVPVGLTQCADGHVSWLEAASPAPSFDGGELGRDVAVSRITASGPADIRSEVLPASPAPVWGRAGCGDTASWVSGDGTAVTVEEGAATRATVSTFRPASEARGKDTSEGTTADGSIHRISADGIVESYTFTPEPRFHSADSGPVGITGATVTGGGDVAPFVVTWDGDPSTGSFSATAFDPDDTTCTRDLGPVTLPADMTLLAATVPGETELSCGR
ncbi:hypothetical protein [Corynebacterium meridianum]|uniref:Uncharacterized protein n=1 Tax=Corynebacterium meridianum TaxID=2765363 RepID=A0A934HWP2_9CORY|nr:hypothetical protein [Corynebacterium meridianum]MBI8988303.1 hypothetical protein [Corynebacterium meridianum]